MHYYKFSQNHHNFIWTFGHVASFWRSTVNLLRYVLSVAISLIISKWNSTALYFSTAHPMVSYLITLHNEQLDFVVPKSHQISLTLRLRVPHYSYCPTLQASCRSLRCHPVFCLSFCTCFSLCLNVHPPNTYLITSNLLLTLWLLSRYNSIPKRRTFKLGQCLNSTVRSRDSFTFLFLVTVPSKAYSEDLNL